MSIITPSGFSVPTIGSIVKFSDLRNAFKGDVGIVKFSDYYRDAPSQYVRNNLNELNGIPLYNTNSILSVSNFYGLTYTYLRSGKQFSSLNNVINFSATNLTQTITINIKNPDFGSYSTNSMSISFQFKAYVLDSVITLNTYDTKNSRKSYSSLTYSSPVTRTQGGATPNTFVFTNIYNFSTVPNSLDIYFTSSLSPFSLSESGLVSITYNYSYYI